MWNSDILSKDAGSVSLLKMSLFHRCFSNILLVKTNYLVYPLSGRLVENGLNDHQQAANEPPTLKRDIRSLPT